MFRRTYVAVLGCLAGWLILTLPAGANFLQNAGFELGPAGGGTPDSWWKYSEAGQESWAARNGTNGMAFWSWSAGAWGGFGQNVSAFPEVGDLITFSIWGLAENSYSSSTHEAWLKIQYWTNNASTPVSEFQQDIYGQLLANRGVWNQYTVVATNALAGVTHVEVVVGGGGFTAGDGSQAVKWDDADLDIGPGPDAPDNLLRSPGFEDGLNWTLGNDLCYEPWAARQGNGGLAMYGWTSGGYAYQDVAASGSSNYEFSIYGSKDELFDLSLLATELKLEFFSDSGVTRISEVTTVVQSAGTAWTRYSVSGVSPEETRTVRATLAFGGTPGDDSFKWDDAKLISTGSPRPGFPVHSSVATGNVFRIGWAGSTSVYYQVWAAEELDGNWHLIRGMALGAAGDQVWRDDDAIARYTNLYYKITARPVTDPEDCDEDGLDDVTELNMGDVDPTNPDSDGDLINDGMDPRPSIPNVPPDVQDIELSSDGNYHNDEPVTIVIQSDDEDGDSIQYRYAVGGGAFTPWQTGNEFVWTPGSGDVGSRTLLIEVRDPWGALSSDSISVYLFRTPPRP